MRIVIVNTRVPFVDGGAEVLAKGLRSALERAGHQVELITIPFKWYPPERIVEQIMAVRLLDLSESVGVKIDRLIGLKFPAYLARHPNKILWILHQHRQAYDLWGHPAGDLQHYPNGQKVREAIYQAERELLPDAKQIFTISRNVADRLSHYTGFSGEALYPPPLSTEVFYCRGAEDYFYFPSRINQLKRQHLVVQALALTRNPVHVCFSGAPDSAEVEAYVLDLASQLGVRRRLQWRGRVTDQEMWNLYARCLAVVYTPVDEDYGYVTLEAMLSCKAVVTCSDSGGPLELVVDKETGRVAEATPESLAAVMDEVWENRAAARQMGEAARQRFEDLRIDWPHVLERLLA